MKNPEQTVIATPEWTTAVRADRVMDERVTGGWVATPAPLSRGAAFTDFTDHVMAVPEGDSDIARGVRYHELAHSRYSPTAVPASLMSQLEVSIGSVRVAEEFRMNLLTTRIHELYLSRNRGMTDSEVEDYREMARCVKAMADGTEKAAADHAVSQDDFRSAVYLMFSTFGLDVHKVVKRRLRMKPEWKRAIGGIDKYLTRNYGGRNVFHHSSNWTSTAPIRYEWTEGFAKREQLLPTGFVVGTLPVANAIEEIVKNRGVGDDTVEEEGDGKFDPTGNPTGVKPTAPRSESKWASLRMGITSLTEPTASFIGKRKRPSITGKIPVRPDRLLTDPERRIFRQEVRGAGGVVVFDCSGSMGVDYEVVRHAVAQFAGATVIAYSNNDPGAANCWVLAKNGRMVSAEEMARLPLNNGNGVDGLALRWALRHRVSRKEFVMWVSDLGVTGEHDNYSHDLLTDCAELCRKHGIVQVPDTDSALEVLADMKRRGGTVPRDLWSQELARVITDINNGRRHVPIVSVATDSY